MKQNSLSDKWFKRIIFFVFGIIIGYIFALLLSKTSNYIQLIGIAFSSLIGIGIPIWREYFVTKSKLSIEISSISRTISDAVKISIEEYPEFNSLDNKESELLLERFAILTRTIDNNPTKRKSKKGITVERLEELFENVEQEFKSLPQKIEEKEKEVEKLNQIEGDSFSETEAKRLNSPIFPEVDFSPVDFSEPESRNRILSEFREKYKNDYEALNKRYLELQSGAASLAIMRNKIEQIKRDLTNNRSYFTISVSLFNSGRLNTSIKAPAILRVYIGRGNYVDLRLTLKDFETRSEVSANSTKVAIFDSPEISNLPEDDRRLINTYWGQSVACVLFIEDVHGNIYSSNAIAFAEGLYQKIIYDRLASAAASYSPYNYENN